MPPPCYPHATPMCPPYVPPEQAVDDTGHDHLTQLKVGRVGVWMGGWMGVAQGSGQGGHACQLRLPGAATAKLRCCACCPPVSALQPRYQEVVDRMVGQLVRLLWQEERRGNGRYRCVSGGTCASLSNTCVCLGSQVCAWAVQVQLWLYRDISGQYMPPRRPATGVALRSGESTPASSGWQQSATAPPAA